jgi:hypothetical protein
MFVRQIDDILSMYGGGGVECLDTSATSDCGNTNSQTFVVVVVYKHIIIIYSQYNWHNDSATHWRYV